MPNGCSPLSVTLCSAEIRTTISNFILDHGTDDTSAPILWEALKCVLRWVFTSKAMFNKQNSLVQIQELPLQIADLERSP